MGWIVADNAKVHKSSQKKGADAEEKKGKKEEKEKEKEEKEKEEPPQPPQQPSLGWRDPLGPLPTHWQCHICEHFNNYLKHGGTCVWPLCGPPSHVECRLCNKF